jgi:hypothetical protein
LLLKDKTNQIMNSQRTKQHPDFYWDKPHDLSRFAGSRHTTNPEKFREQKSCFLADAPTELSIFGFFN